MEWQSFYFTIFPTILLWMIKCRKSKMLSCHMKNEKVSAIALDWYVATICVKSVHCHKHHWSSLQSRFMNIKCIQGVKVSIFKHLFPFFGSACFNSKLSSLHEIKSNLKYMPDMSHISSHKYKNIRFLFEPLKIWKFDQI